MALLALLLPLPAFAALFGALPEAWNPLLPALVLLPLGLLPFALWAGRGARTAAYAAAAAGLLALLAGSWGGAALLAGATGLAWGHATSSLPTRRAVAALCALLAGTGFGALLAGTPTTGLAAGLATCALAAAAWGRAHPVSGAIAGTVTATAWALAGLGWAILPAGLALLVAAARRESGWHTSLAAGIAMLTGAAAGVLLGGSLGMPHGSALLLSVSAAVGVGLLLKGPGAGWAAAALALAPAAPAGALLGVAAACWLAAAACARSRPPLPLFSPPAAPARRVLGAQPPPLARPHIHHAPTPLHAAGARP